MEKEHWNKRNEKVREQLFDGKKLLVTKVLRANEAAENSKL